MAKRVFHSKIKGMFEIDYLNRTKYLKALAHPIRLKIIMELATGVKCVSDINEVLNDKQPIVSKHLHILRGVGIIDCYTKGPIRCYFIADKTALKVLRLLNGLGPLNQNFAGGKRKKVCKPKTIRSH